MFAPLQSPHIAKLKPVTPEWGPRPYSPFANRSIKIRHDIPMRYDLVRQSAIQTRYMDMLLDLDNIPAFHNILASFFIWLLLAGYVVFPATFTTVNTNNRFTEAAKSELESKVLDEVRNAPLLGIAACCCFLGSTGLSWLWWKWRANYIWMVNKMFLPCLLNAIAGLISTLVNVYSAQNGKFSVTAKITIIATGVCSAITATFFLLYNNWALSKVKARHQLEMERAQRWKDLHSYDEMVKRNGYRDTLGPEGMA